MRLVLELPALDGELRMLEEWNGFQIMCAKLSGVVCNSSFETVSWQKFETVVARCWNRGFHIKTLIYVTFDISVSSQLTVNQPDWLLNVCFSNTFIGDLNIHYHGLEKLNVLVHDFMD